MITFSCGRCGHEFEVDDSFAGKEGRCKQCGYAMTIPSGGFRLRPIPDDEQDTTRPAAIEPYEPAGDEPPPAVLEPGEYGEGTLVDEPIPSEGIPEEFLADRAPLALNEGALPDQEEGPIELAPDENRRERS